MPETGDFKLIEAPSIAGAIAANAARHPDKIAAEDTFQTLSYAALDRRARAVLAAARAEPLLADGENCALLAHNRIEYLELIAGLSAAGNAVAMPSPRLQTEEIQGVCDDARVRVLFVDPANETKAAAASFDSVEKIIVLGPGYETWQNRVPAAATLPDIDQERPFTIPYTSGTTGKPKGVLLSMRSRVQTFFGMQTCYGCFGPQDRFLALAPMCHGAGLVFPLASVYFGGYTRILDAFDPEQVLKVLDESAISGVFMVPTHFHRILNLPEDLLVNNSGFPDLKSIISNAAPLSQALKEKIIGFFGTGLLHETYGSTEAGIVANLEPADQLRKIQCVGKPFSATAISIRSEEGRECAPGEIGELFSRSAYLFNGYWQRDAETAAAMQDGWCTVGDMARFDEEGYVYIVDRKKDMIITGGINVYPREVEEVLAKHPQVLEAAVVGLPDEEWGERIKAFIVTCDGASVDDAQLRRHCEPSLAGFKIPREFETILQLPRNASGKVMKKALRDR